MKFKGKSRPLKFDVIKGFQLYCERNDDGTMRSYRHVANIMGVSEFTVEKWASRGEWVAKRDKLGEKAEERFIEGSIELIQKTNERHYKLWNKALDVVDFEVNLMERKQKALIKKNLERGVSIDDVANIRGLKNYAKDINDLFNAMKNAINGQRVVLSLPTEVSKAEVTNINRGETLTEEDFNKIDEKLGKYAIPRTDNTTKVDSTGVGGNEGEAIPTEAI